MQVEALPNFWAGARLRRCRRRASPLCIRPGRPVASGRLRASPRCAHPERDAQKSEPVCPKCASSLRTGDDFACDRRSQSATCARRNGGAQHKTRREGKLYKKIAVPVDLAHTDKLDKAINVAADMAKLYGADVTYISVTAATPGPGGHNPQEYERKLQQFADEQGKPARGGRGDQCRSGRHGLARAGLRRPVLAHLAVARRRHGQAGKGFGVRGALTRPPEATSRQTSGRNVP